jgi:outer membrane usher protein
MASASDFKSLRPALLVAVAGIALLTAGELSARERVTAERPSSARPDWVVPPGRQSNSPRAERRAERRAPVRMASQERSGTSSSTRPQRAAGQTQQRAAVRSRGASNTPDWVTTNRSDKPDWGPPRSQANERERRQPRPLPRAPGPTQPMLPAPAPAATSAASSGGNSRRQASSTRTAGAPVITGRAEDMRRVAPAPASGGGAPIGGFLSSGAEPQVGRFDLGPPPVQLAQSRSAPVRLPGNPSGAAPVNPSTGTSAQPVSSAPTAVPTSRRRTSTNGAINIWGREVTLVVPLREGPREFGNVPLRISVDDVVSVQADQLLSTLGASITPEISAQLLAAAQPGGQLRLDRLPADTIALRYDAESTSLLLTRGVDTSPVQDLSVAPSSADDTLPSTRPDGFSAYLSTRAGAGWEHVGDAKGFEGLTTSSIFAANFRGLVFETEAIGRFGGSFADNGSEGVVRQASRLVFDREAESQRWMLGDIQATPFSYMNAPQLLGLSVSRNREVFTRDRRNLQPTSLDTFNVSQTSEVDVIVNGQLQQRIRLEPGRYRLTDFPFAGGSNEVQVIATDRTGRQETTRFNRFFDFNLLASGEYAYDIALGQLASPSSDGPVYENDNWLLTGSMRRGMNDHLTLGAGAQFDESTRLAVIDVLSTNRFGTISLGAAVSQNDDSGVGGAGRITFQHQRPTIEGRTPVSFALGADVTTKDFTTPGQIDFANNIDPQDNESWRVFGATNLQIDQDRFITLSADAGDERGGDETVYGAQASYGFRLSGDLFVSVLANYRSVGDQDNFGLGLNFSRRLSTNTFATANVDTIQRRYDAGVTHSTLNGAGPRSLTARLAGNEDSASFAASYNALLNRAEVGIDHTAQYSIDRREVQSSTTSIQLGAAIATAGGVVAIGRPINDSFVIVSAHDSLDGADVEVDATEIGYTARSDQFGPALVSDLSAYLPRPFTATSEMASLGGTLDNASQRIRPTYRSGAAVTIGSEYTISATGRLVDLQGRPVTLISGMARLQGDTGEGRAVEFFTNGNGRFALLGLKPGVWVLKTTGANPLTFTVTIPENVTGLVQLNDVGAAP